MAPQIYNKQKLILNEQLNQILDLVEPHINNLRMIAIFDSPADYWLFLSKRIRFRELFISVQARKVSDFYDPFVDRINILAHNIHESERPELQFEIIYSLVHCCRERHYYYDYLKRDGVVMWDVFHLNDIAYCLNKVSTEYADLIRDFTVNFMNNNARAIADIMGWDYLIDFTQDQAGKALKQLDSNQA